MTRPAARRRLRAGDVLRVELPTLTPAGHEQMGTRPAVVVGVPADLGPVRYPLLVVVPLTTQQGEWSASNRTLYPTLPAGAGGLTADSAALLDNVRGVDAARVRGFLGSLGAPEVALLQAGLRELLGLQ